jgi:hypothetical protein
MKVRKLMLVAALLMLSAALLAAPVQAGRAHTPITFSPTKTAAMDFPNARWSGPVLHVDWLVDVPVNGSGPQVTGRFSLTMHALVVYSNAHVEPNPEGSGWGPINGTWKLVTEQGTWEGTVHMFPMCKIEEFPKSFYMNGRGNGTGAYENMHISWGVSAVSWDTQDWDFSGEIVGAHE